MTVCVCVCVCVYEREAERICECVCVLQTGCGKYDQGTTMMTLDESGVAWKRG